MIRLILGAIFLASLVGEGALAAPQKGKVFDNWGVGCEPMPDGKSERCFAQQVQISNQNQGRVLSVAVGRLGPKKEPMVIVLLPFGSNLQVAPAFRVDDGAQINMTYQTCVAEGCRASVTLDEAGMKKLLGGNQMTVGVMPWGATQAVLMSVPLKGIAAAVAASE